MDKSKITYSSDTGKISIQDLQATVIMAENAFRTQDDPTQINTSDGDDTWFLKNCLEYNNIIKYDGQVIGYTLMLPCSKEIMNDFITKKINEANLYEEIQKTEPKSPPETIYACATVVLPNYQGLGLAALAFTKTIDKVSKGTNPPIFYDGYSIAGKNLAKKTQKRLNIENLLERK